jgi:hypothetical protein
MARQLPSGQWTSKLGEMEDIQHAALQQLDGLSYGRVVQYLKRTRRWEFFQPDKKSFAEISEAMHSASD